jgi:hypothetical protein
LLEALAVTVIIPRVELCEAESIVMTSFGTAEVVAGADVVVPSVVDGPVVTGGEDVVELGFGAQEVVVGAKAPGHGLSWPTMTSEAGGVTPNVPGV